MYDMLFEVFIVLQLQNNLVFSPTYPKISVNEVLYNKQAKEWTKFKHRLVLLIWFAVVILSMSVFASL